MTCWCVCSALGTGSEPVSREGGSGNAPACDSAPNLGILAPNLQKMVGMDFSWFTSSLGITPPEAEEELSACRSVGAEQCVIDAAGPQNKCSCPDLLSQHPEEVLLEELGALHIPKQTASITEMLIERAFASSVLGNSTHGKHNPSNLLLNSLCTR